MFRRLVPSVLLALACALVIGAVAPVAGALTRDAQMKQNVRLLRTYIDGYASARSFVFPAATVVRKGGLPAPIWPTNPWTGKPMAPGTGRGAYTYRPGAGGAAYTLTGHLSQSTFGVTGGAPSWLADERAAAAADLDDAHAATVAARADAAAARQERDAALSDAASARQERDAAAADLATAQTTLDAKKAELAMAQAQLAGSQTALATAQAQLAGSQTALAAAQADLSTARAQLAAATADLTTAQADVAAARDQAAELGARVIKGYVEQWGMLNNATSPAAADVGRTGTVGALFSYWPDNPFTGQPMASGGSSGDYAYSQSPDGTSYTMSARLAARSASLDGTVPQQLKNALDNVRSQAADENIRVLQAAIDRYAMDNNDVFPAPGQVSWASLGAYVDLWPRNPWTNVAMVDASTQGNFTYVRSQDGYTLTSHLEGGIAGDTVDNYYADHYLGVRDHLKNVYCQAAVQVVKEYIEEWKAANAGTPPTADQLTKTGAVGLVHTWWPVNPWYGSPMTNEDVKGDFQYAPGVGGSYTLTVRQQPDMYYAQYYTAL